MDAMAVKRAGAKWMVVLTGFFLHACALLTAPTVQAASGYEPATQAMPVWTLDVSRLPPANIESSTPPMSDPEWYRPSPTPPQLQQSQPPPQPPPLRANLPTFVPTPPVQYQQQRLVQPQPVVQALPIAQPQSLRPYTPVVAHAAPLPDVIPSPAWRQAVIPPLGNAAPVASASGFTIGAGDTVQIDVLGRPELLAKGNVAADGRVTVALVGPVNIGGLTPVQAAERIAYAYKQGEYLVSPQVTVTMVDYQSQLLTVLGEVRTPGRFPLRTRLSVLDGLALAGGISEQGSNVAYLLRPQDSVVTRYEIDLDALIQSGAGQQYFEMLAGDTLVVPKSEVFYIYGEAKNPNAYKLKPGMTVIQALSLAGGLTDKGSDKRIDIRRRDGSGSLNTLTASLNEPLQADDVIYIRERLF